MIAGKVFKISNEESNVFSPIYFDKIVIYHEVCGYVLLTISKTKGDNHKMLQLQPLLKRKWNHYGVCIWIAKGYHISKRQKATTLNESRHCDKTNKK